MRCFVSEFLGTLFLVATVVGSGIMADNLSMGNHAVALLANAISTGAILYCLLYTSPSPRDKRQSRMPSSA